MFIEASSFRDGGMVSGATVATKFLNVDRIDWIDVTEGAHGVELLEVHVGGRSHEVADKGSIRRLLDMLPGGVEEFEPKSPPRETLVQYETPTASTRIVAPRSGAIDDADSDFIDGSAAD